MNRIAFFTCIILFVLSSLVVSPASGQVSCAGIDSLSECPVTGCGGGDGELNKKKNRTVVPPAANILSRTLEQIRGWQQPNSWQSRSDRDSLAFRENKAVVVMGYLRDARKSGRESTNCKLGGETNNDFHLDLISNPDAPRASAVAAEITPRFRPTGWDFEKLDLLGEYTRFVRVTGWIMLDTMHISNPLTRATNWEIHPVTKFEVCASTITRCRSGRGWVLLEEWEFEEEQ